MSEKEYGLPGPSEASGGVRESDLAAMGYARLITRAERAARRAVSALSNASECATKEARIEMLRLARANATDTARWLEALLRVAAPDTSDGKEIPGSHQ